MLYNNLINLVDDHGLVVFDSQRDFFLKVVQLLYHDFPKGYIDYKVFLHEHTWLKGTSLTICCKDIERNWVVSEDFCIEVPWTYGVETHGKITVLLRKMTRYITGEFFDLREFYLAWSSFFNSINKE